MAGVQPVTVLDGLPNARTTPARGRADRVTPQSVTATPGTEKRLECR